MQGPFRGVAGALVRVFGGTVTMRPGGPDPREVAAIFRRVPRRIDAGQGEVEVLVPVLRGRRDELADFAEGDLVDPGDGRLYRCLFPEETASPAPDALVTFQLEDVET